MYSVLSSAQAAIASERVLLFSAARKSATTLMSRRVIVGESLLAIKRLTVLSLSNGLDGDEAERLNLGESGSFDN